MKFHWCNFRLTGKQRLCVGTWMNRDYLLMFTEMILIEETAEHVIDVRDLQENPIK
jgi:hypothetical protein